MSRLQRGLYPLALTLAGSLLLNNLLQGNTEPPPTHAIVKSAVGDTKGYVLPYRYNGLTAYDDVESATVSITRSESDRVPRYHFDLFNRLAFEGENMFDVDLERISPHLRAEFNQVYSAFCARHAGYEPLSAESRFKKACYPQPMLE